MNFESANSCWGDWLYIDLLTSDCYRFMYLCLLIANSAMLHALSSLNATSRTSIEKQYIPLGISWKSFSKINRWKRFSTTMVFFIWVWIVDNCYGDCGWSMEDSGFKYMERMSCWVNWYLLLFCELMRAGDGLKVRVHFFQTPKRRTWTLSSRLVESRL